MLLVIYDLRMGTHLHKSDFKKPGTRQPVGVRLVKNIPENTQ